MEEIQMLTKLSNNNNYLPSTNLLVFPTSTTRINANSQDAYPDGRRFSEYNITQFINSLVDYTALGSDGFVCDYTYDSDKKQITGMTLLIRGYIFQIKDAINVDNYPTLYASIIVQTFGDDLDEQSQDIIRINEITVEDDTYCEGLIFTTQKPILGDGTLNNMDDPSGALNLILSSQACVYTIPIIESGKIIAHKFTSESIRNIDGGVC